MAEAWTKEEKAAVAAAHLAIQMAEEDYEAALASEFSTDDEIDKAERAANEAHQELNDLIEDIRSNHEYDDVPYF